MVNNVKFAPSTRDCENKILVMKKNKGFYQLIAIDKNDSIPQGGISKITEIASILRSSARIESDDQSIESVAKRINAVTEKHNQSSILHFFKRILPKFIFEKLPFACMKEYQGVDAKELIPKKALSLEVKSKLSKALKSLSNTDTDGSLDAINTAYQKQYHFSPLNYALENPNHSQEELYKALKLRVQLSESIKEVIEPTDIQESLETTVQQLCEKHHISEEDVIREARLFGVDKTTAQMKMVKRLTLYLKAGLDPQTHSPSLSRRQEATGYELSILKGIEKAFKKSVLNEGKTYETKLENHSITVFSSGSEVFVAAQEAGTGTSKVVTFAANYFEMRAPEEKEEYVTLRMKKGPSKKTGSETSADPSTSEGETPAFEEETLEQISIQFDQAVVRQKLEETAPSGSVVIKETEKKGAIPDFEKKESEKSIDGVAKMGEMIDSEVVIKVTSH